MQHVVEITFSAIYNCFPGYCLNFEVKVSTSTKVPENNDRAPSESRKQFTGLEEVVQQSSAVYFPMLCLFFSPLMLDARSSGFLVLFTAQVQILQRYKSSYIFSRLTLSNTKPSM